MRGAHSFAPQTLLSFQTSHLNPSNKTFNWQRLWFSQCPTSPSPSVLQRMKQQEASPTLLLRDSNRVHNLHWVPVDFHHMSARHSKTPIITYTGPYIFSHVVARHRHYCFQQATPGSQFYTLTKQPKPTLRTLLQTFKNAFSSWHPLPISSHAHLHPPFKQVLQDVFPCTVATGHL